MTARNLVRPAYAARRMLKRVHERLRPDAPWIAPSTVRYLEGQVTPSTRVLEFGSGRSTMWFAMRCAHVTSVEHDASWYERVSGTLRERQLEGRVDLRLVPLDHPIDEGTRPAYDPEPEYVSEATRAANGSFDVVLVDGHYRQACILASLAKLKPGGLLVVDNSNWLALPEWGVPSNWTVVQQGSFYGDVTTVWRRPVFATSGDVRS